MTSRTDRRPGDPAVELREARIVDFPLRGEWHAAQSPADRIPSHGTDILGQAPSTTGFWLT